MINTVPSAKNLNSRLLSSAENNLVALNRANQRIAEMRESPDYDHADDRQQLDSLANDLAIKRAALEGEIQARRDLDQAFRAKDKDAIKSAKNKLKDNRNAYAQIYGNKRSVEICQRCIDKKLSRIHKVRRPTTPDQMMDTITGIFEGKEPDYCAVADSATDAGGLSYGKHQAAEKAGMLYAMLKSYSDQTDPVPDPATKSRIDSHLAKFSENKKEYNGTASERASFKTELRRACADPAMQTAQDRFFHDNYMVPALMAADDMCVKSNLGKAMFYDSQIQTSPKGNRKIRSQAMRSLHKEDAHGCKPCDPNGPSEEEFLNALNDARRDYVTQVGGDAAKSIYREAFFAQQLNGGNMDLSQDMIVKGIPVKGLPPPQFVIGKTIEILMMYLP